MELTGKIHLGLMGWLALIVYLMKSQFNNEIELE